MDDWGSGMMCAEGWDPLGPTPYEDECIDDGGGVDDVMMTTTPVRTYVDLFFCFAMTTNCLYEIVIGA